MLKIGVLDLLKNAVPLSTIRVTIPAILYTFTKVAFGTYNLSPSSFEKFSTVENLIKAKITKDCNIVHNDCAIAFESWSGYLMKNRPAGDNNNFGILISFNYPRKTQLYISGGSMYTRVNQGTEDYNSWSLWLRCSN